MGPLPRRDTSKFAAGVPRDRAGGRRALLYRDHGSCRLNVREVSEWAGHNSVAFTLTRYGSLFEDNADAAIEGLNGLLEVLR
jgi:hypothetical protein